MSSVVFIPGALRSDGENTGSATTGMTQPNPHFLMMQFYPSQASPTTQMDG
jgi:hypothetical protein